MDLPKRLYYGREVDRLYRDLLRAEAGAGIDFPGDPNVFLNGEGEFVEGAGALSVWMPDAPPLTPHADDNEFTTTVDDFTSDGVAVWSLDAARRRAQAVFTRSADNQSAKFYKDIPDSEFSIISKVGALVLPKADAVFDCGIVVAEGDGAGDSFVLLSSYQYRSPADFTTVWGVRGLHFSDFDTVVGDADLGPHTDQRSYLRIAVDGDDIILYTSVDGQNWMFQWLTTGLGWTPTKMGLGMWFAGSFGTGEVARAHWDFFRVASGAGSSDPHGHQIGRYV